MEPQRLTRPPFTTTLQEYAPRAMTTKRPGSPPYIWALGLAGETFELLRAMDGDGNVVLESGDVLWYCVALADDLGIMQEYLDRFARYPNVHQDLRTALYTAVGDTTEHLKKVFRKHGLDLSRIDKELMAKNLAYISRCLYWLSVERSHTWCSVMTKNLEKLSGREAAGTINSVQRVEG